MSSPHSCLVLVFSSSSSSHYSPLLVLVPVSSSSSPRPPRPPRPARSPAPPLHPRPPPTPHPPCLSLLMLPPSFLLLLLLLLFSSAAPFRLLLLLRSSPLPPEPTLETMMLVRYFSRSITFPHANPTTHRQADNANGEVAAPVRRMKRAARTPKYQTRNHLAPRRRGTNVKSVRGAAVGSKTLSSSQSWMTFFGSFSQWSD